MSTMDQYQTDPKLLCLLFFQNAIPIVLLATTSKGSLLRYLAIPLMLWNTKLALYPVQGPTYVSLNCLGGCVALSFSALDFLFISRKDARDFAGPDGKPATLISRLWGATRVVMFPRAINSPRQAKNTPPLPAYYAGGASRGRFLAREFAIASWQYLVLDAAAVLALKGAWEQKENGVLPYTGIGWGFSLEKWAELTVSHLIGWFFVARVIIGFYYRIFAILYVACGLGPASECPPMFGNMADAYTLRNFWGKFWHQMLRLPFTGVSNFISRDVLRLPKPSIIERYFNVFLVFLFSGILHVATDAPKGISAQESGSMTFFLSFALAYMIEDGVQTLWKRLYGPPAGGSPRLWQRVIGYCWVGGWLVVASTPFFGAAWGRPECQMEFVPFSFVETFGFPVVSGALLFGAVVLKLVFKVEI